MKTYKAIIWDGDPNKPGHRVSVLAEDLDDAKRRLEEKYGKGHVFNLHNEEEESDDVKHRLCKGDPIQSTGHREYLSVPILRDS